MLKGYTTAEKIRKYLGLDAGSGSGSDGEYDDWIEAVETYIDRFTGRDFTDEDFYPAIPADIKFVATVLVSGIINTGLQGEGEVQSISVGRYSVTYRAGSQQENDFKQTGTILGSYKKYKF